MQANETLLELWIEALCAELGELSGALITVSTAPHETSRTDAYETVLLTQGPVQGEIFITVDGRALVQFTQLSSGEPLDPDVSCNPERIESWRRLLDSTAGRVSTRLTADFTDASNSRCVILLADTHRVAGNDPLVGEPGSRIRRWLLQAGQSRLAILARVKIEFPEEMIPAVQPAAVATEKQEGDPQKKIAQENHSSTDAFAAGNDTAPESSTRLPASEPVQPESANAEASRRRRAARELDESPVQPHRLDLLLDIELEATLRFGAIEMPLREVLELGPGDVLSLDRHVQEPVELVVGDRIVARGEVVLIGGNFGLHVTQVAEPRRRLETIRCLF